MLTIYRSEASASLRRVPMWLVLSNGTAPATAEAAGQPQISWHPRGTATVNTAATLSLLSANAGLYHVELSASEVSALGVFSVHFRSATAIAQTVFGKIVNYDSGDSVRFGQFALPNVGADLAGGLIVMGTGTNQLQPSLGSVGLRAIIHSQATVGGADNITPRNYSGVSVEIKTGGIQTTSYGLGNYSGVSFEVKTGGIQTTSYGLGNYSGVSFEIKTGGIQPVSMGAGNYSGVSVEVKTKGIDTNSIVSANYSGVSFEVKSGGIQTGSVGVGNYSGVSVEIKTGGVQVASVGKGAYSGVSVEVTTGGIQVASVGVGSYSGVTIDGAKFLSPAGERSAASSLLSTNMGGTTARLFQQGWEVLRNKVQVSGSTMTVFKGDDTTSSWTATISTGTATVYGVAPGIA